MPSAKIPEAQPKRIPIKEDFLTTPLSPSANVRLKGSKCQTCGEVLLGKRIFCENCGSENMGEIIFSNRGKLYTYAIIMHRPPGDYKGPDPFVPFGEGFVELPEGIRIIAPLTENKNLKIGMELELVIDKLYMDEEGNEVMAFKFKPV